MNETEQRDKDIDVARHQAAEAREAVEEGDYVGAIEAASSIINFAARAAERDDPVATLEVHRAGNHESDYINVAPGEIETVRVDGSAKICIEGHARFRKASSAGKTSTQAGEDTGNGGEN